LETAAVSHSAPARARRGVGLAARRGAAIVRAVAARRAREETILTFAAHVRRANAGIP
jgi:hypothetical protein